MSTLGRVIGLYRAAHVAYEINPKGRHIGFPCVEIALDSDFFLVVAARARDTVPSNNSQPSALRTCHVGAMAGNASVPIVLLHVTFPALFSA